MDTSTIQVIQIIMDVLSLILIPFVTFTVINIIQLKTDMKWVIGGMKILGDRSGVILHSPHTPEFDALIERFWHGTLTKDDAVKLCHHLEAIISEDTMRPINEGHPYSPGQKSTAVQMLAAVATICRVHRESTINQQPTDKPCEIKP